MKITEQDVYKKLYSTRPLADLTKIEKKESLNTGLSIIDNNFGFPCGYYVIVGNPGVGKSWFALWLARMFYRHDLMKSVFFSLEMPEQLIRQRILQQWSDLNKSQLESGNDTSEAVKLLASDVIIIDEFYSDDTKKQTPQAFRQWVDEYYKMGYRFFQMDHFHELGGASVNETNQKVVETWGLVFQQICKEYNDIWLIIYAQPNSSKNKILKRSNLLGSKALTYKCDYFLSLNKNVDEDEIDVEDNLINGNNDIVLWIDKTRYTEKTKVGLLIEFSETGNFQRWNKHAK